MTAIGIQIVEGNPHLRSLLGWHLQQLGYVVYQSNSLRQGRQVFEQRQPTLVILDSDLPDGDGLEFCSWLQQQQRSLILMLSARNAETDVVAGLQAGADDYISKPFGMQEFMARVEALLRRYRVVRPPTSLELGDLQINPIQRRVYFQQQPIDLTPQEFSLLYVLASANGLPLSRTELLKKAWPEAIDNPRTIDTHILSLRKKMETDPRQPHLIQTVRNVGYRFNVEALENGQTHPPSQRPPTYTNNRKRKTNNRQSASAIPVATSKEA
ncbi:response regulator transcription factor [Geitlerinema sp. PCC 9228]|uniref:response regulator transcription factor n=1 Tax=Geitlerinema sp. PCC 9228 TaxID=111611 RepID=UPI0008F9BCFF|nr:response regulator transcription factor [Geitlerinema sp. PCC 9228]